MTKYRLRAAASGYKCNLMSTWNTARLAGTVNSIQNWEFWLFNKCYLGGAKCNPTVSLRKQRSPENFSIHWKHSLILTNSVFVSLINNSWCAKQSRKTKTVVQWVNTTKTKLSSRHSPLKPTVPQCEHNWSCCMASFHSSPRNALSMGRHLPSISHSIHRIPEHISIYRNWRFGFQMRIHLLGPWSTWGTQKLHRASELQSTNFQEPSGHKDRLLISLSLYQVHLFPCRTVEKKKQTDHLSVGKAQKAHRRAVEKLKQCDDTGRKASGMERQTKVGLGCYCMYIHRSEAKLQETVWEAEILGTITEESKSQNADRKRVIKESDYKSTDVFYLSNTCVMCIVTFETGRISLMIRNVSIALRMEAHLCSLGPTLWKTKSVWHQCQLKTPQNLITVFLKDTTYAEHVLPQNSKAKNYIWQQKRPMS